MTSPTRWLQLQALFGQALACAPADRDAFVAGACGDDASLRAELQALLAADQGASIGGAEAIRRAAGGILASATQPRIGLRLGPWRIVDHIADGGMGAVYRAERADGRYQQQVAVKLLHPAYGSPQAAARMEAERQILARLTHPHIARLFDGGTTPDGVPYLVMEYVNGEPIDAFCDARQLDTAARLRLFLRVCDAVDHAHRNLVVHRDLKPSNILVDPDGMPKLLDFGIAKLADGDATGVTLADQRMFTPSHASPEQIRGEPLTTATDVYALGVLLYQLLARRLPHDPAGRSAAQMALAVTQDNPPPPSTVVDVQAPRLRRELRGDLDTIVLMAMRKEPSRRYRSVQALADDIGRYFRREPVSARPDTLGYRWRRYVQRHRAGVVAALAGIVASAALTGVYTWQLRQERDQAELERRRADRIADSLVEIFNVANPEEGGATSITAREVLDRAGQRMRADTAQDDPSMRARLAFTLGRAYVGLGADAPAVEWLEAALAGFRDTLPPSDPMILDTLRRLADQYRDNNHFDTARARAQESLELARSARPADNKGIADAQISLGFLDTHLGDFAGAIAKCQDAVQRLDADPAASTHRVVDKRSAARQCLGEAFVRLDRFDEADRAFGDAAALVRERLGEHHPSLNGLMNDWAGVAFRRGHYLEAARRLEQLVAIDEKHSGPDSSNLAARLINLGTIYRTANRYAEADRATQRALDIQRRITGDDHRIVALGNVNLAYVRREQGRWDEAEALLRQALAIEHRILPPDADDIASTMENLGSMLCSMQRPLEGLPVLESSLQRFSARLGPQHSSAISVLTWLGSCRLQTDQTRANRELHEAVDRAARAGLSTNMTGLMARQQLAVALRKSGESEQALRMHDEIERDFVAAYGAQRPPLALTMLERTRILVSQHEWDRAAAELARLLELVGATQPSTSALAGHALVLQAEVARGRGRLVEAKALAVRGLEVLRSRLPAVDPELDRAVRLAAALGLPR